jgi:hypothetical protein
VPDIPSSQGAVLSFRGEVLGVLQNISQSFAVGNKHEVTSMKSPVTGAGQNARVLKQYNVTSIEPGTITARFLGFPGLVRSDIGKPGYLLFSWGSGASNGGQAFLETIDEEFVKGELIQWAAVFQFSGFDS